MAAGNSPIVVHEVLTLTSLGIEPRFITFNHVTMESDKYIVVYESEPENRLAMIDMEMPTTEPLRTPMVADSALMNPDTRIIALKASKMPRNSKGHITGEVHDFVHIFNIENQIRKKIRSCELSEQVEFWKWITPKVLGMVTHASVYHWSIEDDYGPIKVFDRADNLAGNQIVNYRCDPTEKWLVLIGLAPGSSQAPQLVKGNMQLFYVDEHRSQVCAAHAASFATLKVPGNENPSTLICYASKEIDGGGITSKLHLVELGARPGKPCGDEWQVRYKIIKGICQGLQYLHKIRINHLDLKPGNILLDVGMEPKIADFGLSRCFDEEQSRVFTKHIYGTRGYIAPEIINNGEISFKSDIFALGIIIIKLLTGHNDYDIENWHKSLNVDCPQVRRCIEIAQACVDDDQHKRPAIDEIIHKLDELETVVDSPAKIQMQFRNRCNSETM